MKPRLTWTLLKYALVGFITTTLVLLGGLSWVVLSPSGTRNALERVLGFSQHVRVDSVSGSLWHGVTLHGLQVSHESADFEAEQLWLSVQWPALRNKVLVIERVGLSNGTLQLKAPNHSNEKGQPPSLPDWPLSIDVQQASVQGFNIWMHSQPAPWQIEDLTLRTTGSAAQMTTQGQLQGKGAGLPDFRLQFDVQHGLNWLQADAISLDSVLGKVSVQGSVDWSEHLAWHVQTQMEILQLDALNLQAFISSPVLRDVPLEGWINLEASSQGAWRSDGPDAQVQVASLQGMVNGQALEGQLRGAVQHSTVQVEPLDMTWGNNHIKVSGQVTPPFDLTFDVYLPELQRLPVFPEMGVLLAGSMRGEGKLRGELSDPDIDAHLHIDQLRFGDSWSVARATAQAQINQQTVRVSAEVTDVEGAGQTLNSAQLTANGTLAAHHATLWVRSTHGTAQLAAQGGLNEHARWQGYIQNLVLMPTEWGQWHMEQATALWLEGRDFVVEPLCISSAAKPARACVEAQRQGPSALLARMQASVDMALARPWLPDELPLEGHAEFEVEARLADLYVDTQLRATAGRFGHLQSHAQNPLDPQALLEGGVKISIDDLAWAEVLAPELMHIQGRATADIALTGSLQAIRPSGMVQINELSFSVPATGVRFVQGTVQAQVGEDRTVYASASIAGVESGPWRMRGLGHVESLSDWQVEMHIEGEPMALMRTTELEVDMRPQLRIQANPELAVVTGELHLPRVAVRVDSLPANAVKESADLVLAGQQPKTAAYRVQTNVELVLGEQVYLSGMGFSSHLQGRLRLRSDGVTPLAAYGEVQLQQGRFSAYGQELSIDPGRLTFNGPLNNPGLAVKASRTVGAYQVGLEMGGTLMTPSSEVFASPDLPQSDALSLLLTGRLLSAGSSGADASMLINALAGLGVRQSDGILQDIGHRVGFDELGLTTDDGLAGTTLTVGKRINSRLMVRYMVGAFDGVSRFVTEYRLNRFWEVEIVSSPIEQRGDLIFRIER